jgi:hypothetical protein
MNNHCSMIQGRVRAVRAILCLSALAFGGSALAQEQETTDNAPTSEQSQDRLYLGNESLESCMKRWDPGTHMTKEAWRQTCLRVRSEREPYVPKQ